MIAPSAYKGPELCYILCRKLGIKKRKHTCVSRRNTTQRQSYSQSRLSRLYSRLQSANGYVRLTDIRQPSFWGVYRWPVEKGFLRSVNFESVQSLTWNQSGEKTRGNHFQLVGFDLGEKIETGFFYRNWSYDVHSNWVVAAQATYNRQSPDRIFVVYQHGEFEGAEATFVTTAMNVIPFRFLSIGIEGEISGRPLQMDRQLASFPSVRV